MIWFIFDSPYFINQKNVAIRGKVLYPGDYAIIKSNVKITDIINRSGGLLTNANADASIHKRRKNCKYFIKKDYR